MLDDRAQLAARSVIASLLSQFYTAHPVALTAFGFVVGTCAGFLLGAGQERRWWRLRVRSGAVA